MPPGKESWQEQRALIAFQLEDLTRRIQQLEKRQNNSNTIPLSTLMKLGGVISGITAALVKLLSYFSELRS